MGILTSVTAIHQLHQIRKLVLLRYRIACSPINSDVSIKELLPRTVLNQQERFMRCSCTQETIGVPSFIDEEYSKVRMTDCSIFLTFTIIS